MMMTTPAAAAPKSKLALLREAAARDDWRAAIAIAARFPRLGAIRNAVLDAHTAYANPRFLAQLGRDPAAAIEAGKSALIAAYRLPVAGAIAVAE